jgi:hypothetical protein
VSQQINLFNPDFRPRRELFTALMLVQVLLILTLVLAGVYAYQYRQAQALNKQAGELAAQLEQEKLNLMKVTAEYAPRARSEALEKRANEMERQLQGEEAVLEVLQGGSLGNTQGYSGYMRAFARQSVNGLWLTAFSIKGAGKEMALAGRTLRPELVPAYIQRLNQEAVIQGGSFTALEMQQPKPAPAADGRPASLPNFLEFRLGAALETVK